jgi:hypothetical protein
VSPELALVDPELAADLRAALPEHPWPAVPRITVERPAPSRVGHARPFLGSFVAVAFVVGVVTVLTVLPRPDRPTFAQGAGQRQIRPRPQPPPVARRQVVTTSRGVTTLRAELVEPRKRPATVTQKTQKPRKTRKTGPALQRPRVKREKPERRRPGTRPQTPPTRDATAMNLTRRPYFAWPPRPAAVYYQVRFLRNGNNVFYQVQTRVPRLRFPPPIRFPRGRYRWIVRPAIRSDGAVRLGDPIVNSTFLIDRD